MAGVHAEYLTGLAKSLEGAGKGKSSGIIEEAARFLGCSKDTVYRRLKSIGWGSGRKTRSDCGKRTVDEDTALTVAGMVKVATRATGKRTMSTKHVLLFEEAHNMPPETIKQLKRINELTNGGFTRLLAVILVGQNELARLLSETNASLREVVQRMELLELRPLRDVESYVAHRCARAGVKFEDVFDASAMPALQQVLTLIPEKGQRKGKSNLYPLFVGNVLTAAMNLAAEIGMPRVNGDVVAQAHKTE